MILLWMPGHRAETVLSGVFGSLLWTVDSETVRCLWYSQSLLLPRLGHCVSIKGTAVEWFKSYLSKRAFSVHLGKCSSSVAPLSCGVPQGSILGPLQFSFNMLLLYVISSHCFADDVQTYLLLNTINTDSLQPVELLDGLKLWLDLNCSCRHQRTS